ncbi:zinc finger, CCHC-type containing protein [Tanacetum coccineum]
MHFLLTTLNVVYVLSTLMPELLDDDMVEEIRRRSMWENDDYICKGHILNSMSDPLFDIYQNMKSTKELSVMEQFNKLLRILRKYTQNGLKMDELIFVSSVIDKLPPSWNDFKHSLNHDKDDMSLVQLGSYLRIEESLRAQESDKGKGKEIAGPSMNMMEDGGKNKNNKQNKGKKHGFKDNGGFGSNKKPKLACWKCGKTGHFKKDCRSETKIDSGVTTHVCKDRCWFKTYEPVEDRSVLYIGDDHFAPIYGKGSAALEFSFGKSITLFNVLYVPKLCKNLILVLY